MRSRQRRAGNDRRVYETFVRTAGSAREQVARGNVLQILTVGDDAEDEDGDIGDAEAIDDCDRQTAPAYGGWRTIRWRVPNST
jgi:hypothetical protein